MPVVSETVRRPIPINCLPTRATGAVQQARPGRAHNEMLPTSLPHQLAAAARAGCCRPSLAVGCDQPTWFMRCPGVVWRKASRADARSPVAGPGTGQHYISRPILAATNASMFISCLLSESNIALLLKRVESERAIDSFIYGRVQYALTPVVIRPRFIDIRLRTAAPSVQSLSQ